MFVNVFVYKINILELDVSTDFRSEHCIAVLNEDETYAKLKGLTYILRHIRSQKLYQ